MSCDCNHRNRSPLNEVGGGTRCPGARSLKIQHQGALSLGGSLPSVKMVVSTWKGWIGIPVVVRKESSSHCRSSRRRIDCLDRPRGANQLVRHTDQYGPGNKLLVLSCCFSQTRFWSDCIHYPPRHVCFQRMAGVTYFHEEIPSQAGLRGGGGVCAFLALENLPVT